jgi:DNA-directed RNA polymerase specialized sigma24 family protein
MTSGPQHARPANTNRTPGFDANVLAQIPRLRKVASLLVPACDKEDLVQSTVEQGLRYWRNYDPSKSLGGWLVYQMRNIAFKQRHSIVPRGSDASLAFIPVAPRQDDFLVAAELLRSVDESPYADTMRLVATGHTSEEIAERHGISRQRVHQKITAFRRSFKRAA